MIEPGSLVGFGLLFVAACWTLSAITGSSAWRGRHRLRRTGPAAERTAAALALVLPPLIAAVLTGGLAAWSLAGEGLGVPDHCDTHGHHLHLCLRHGAAWASVPWAVAPLTVVVAVLAVRALRGAVAAWHTRARLRLVTRSSRPLCRIDGIPVRLVASRLAFCYVTGLRRPHIFVGHAAWDGLAADERRALLAHERAHVSHGDLWRRPALAALAALGAPMIAQRALSMWLAASERLCDRRAADATGDAPALASALVALVRAAPPLAPCSFIPGPGTVEDRVYAVLDETDDGRRAAARWLAAGWACVASTLALAAWLAEPLHHALETLLGGF